MPLTTRVKEALEALPTHEERLEYLRKKMDERNRMEYLINLLRQEVSGQGLELYIGYHFCQHTHVSAAAGSDPAMLTIANESGGKVSDYVLSVITTLFGCPVARISSTSQRTR